MCMAASTMTQVAGEFDSFVAVGGDMSMIARRSEALLAEINAP